MTNTTNTTNTTVLITGANKGLGLEAARRLGQLGWTVFLGSRDPGRGDAAVKELTSDGLAAITVPLDVTSDQSVAAAVEVVKQHTDRLDVLINNAGATGQAVHPAEATSADLQPVFDTNVYGPVRVTHAFLPLLRMADNPRVMMVSSAGGSFAVVTDPDQATSKIHELAYTASKAALNMITVRYAQAIPEIKFNVVTPGETSNHRFVATDMNQHAGQMTVTEGTDVYLRFATIGPDGPTGVFHDRLGELAW